MTDDRHLSSVIETWLAEGPIQMPDRVFDEVADRIAVLGYGALSAGDYAFYPFLGDALGMSVTVTVPDGGWQGFPDFAILGPRGTGAPDGVAIAFRQAAGVYDDPCHWDRAGTGSYNQPSATVVGPAVDDLVASLRANRSYLSTPPVDVVIDGYSGKQLDLQLPSDVDSGTCDKPAGHATGDAFVFLPLAGDDSVLYVQGPGNRWHLRILDVAGSRIIIVVADYAGTPTQDQAAAQAIVDSIRFTP